MLFLLTRFSFLSLLSLFDRLWCRGFQLLSIDQSINRHDTIRQNWGTPTPQGFLKGLILILSLFVNRRDTPRLFLFLFLFLFSSCSCFFCIRREVFPMPPFFPLLLISLRSVPDALLLFFFFFIDFRASPARRNPHFRSSFLVNPQRGT